MNDNRPTVAEEELMNIFWNEDRPLTSVEILELAAHKSWKGNYLHKMLHGLQKKGFIEVCGTVQYGKQYAREFTPIITREEYAANLLSWQGVNASSFAKIAMALVKRGKKDEKPNEKLILELEKMIAQLKNSGEK